MGGDGSPIREKVSWIGQKILWLLGLAFFFGSIAGSLLYLDARSMKFAESPTYLDALRVFGSVILSAALFALYARMSNIQSDQVAIQDKQTDIMDAELRPVLEVKDVSARGDFLEVVIRNIGNGIARDLSSVIHVLVYNSDTGEKHYFSTPVNKNRLRTEYSSVAQMPPSGEQLEVKTEIYLRSEENQQLDREFDETVQDFIERNDDIGYDQMYCQVELEYDHLMTEGPKSKYLAPFRAPIPDDLNVETVLNNKQPIEGDFTRFTEDENYGFENPGEY